MLKKKALALLLAAATALTVFPPPVLADDTTAQSDTPSVLLYDENFESGTVKFYSAGNEGLGATAASTTYSNATDTDGNKYGTFNPTATAGVWGRNGTEFNSYGITAGKLRVEFRFRPNEGTFKGFGSFFIGNCDQVGANIGKNNDARGNLLTLIDVNSAGKLNTLNVNADKTATPLTDSAGNAATVEKNKWYSCSAVVDLDNRGIDVKVTADDDASKVFKASATNLAIRTSEWGNWPAIAKNEPAIFKDIFVLSALDIDDIKIYCDPIEATGFKLIRGDDGYKGRFTFNIGAADVDTGAVKIGETALSGTLSSDGGMYTVDLPSDLVSDTEYTVTFDQSKIKTQTAQQAGEGIKTFTFTIKKEILLYSEDFESANPEIHVFTDTTGGYLDDATYLTNNEERFKVAQYASNTQNNTQYGSFYSGKWGVNNKEYYRRVGYQFNKEGLTKGKVRVKFKFRSNEGDMTYGIFFLGNNTTGLNWLACVGFDKYQYKMNGTKKTISNPGIIKMVDQASVYFKNSFSNSSWYSYEAMIDLDSESIDASVYDEDGNLVKDLTWTVGSATRATTDTSFKNWPNSSGSFSVKSFAAYTGIDLDDIEIYTDQPLEATGLKFFRNDGKAYPDEVSFLTARNGQLTFNYTVDEVQAGAIKIGETELTTGTISEDGYTYTFDIPADFAAGVEHTITVDYSKIKMKAAQQVGEGTKEFTFTPSGTINFSGDFDKTSLDFKSKGNDGTGSTLKETQFKIMDDNGNKYGRSFYILENDTTDGTAKYYTTDWSRPGIDFDENGVTDGKLKVHFRFRPTAETFENKTAVYTDAAKNEDKKANLTSFGSVLIGNSDQMGINGAGERIGEMKNNKNVYQDDARGNWLSVIDVNYNGKLGTLGVGGGGVTLKDSNGDDAVVQQGTWYTCDAVIDLDNQGVDIRVVEDGTNKVFKVSKTGLARRVDRSEWNNWPTATQPCFKSFGVLAAIDIDDIQIQTDYSPSLTATADKLTAKATTVEKDNHMLIVQYREDDRIADVAEATFTLEGDAAVYSKDVDWVSGAIKAKAFLWDNLNNAKPLQKHAEITKP